MSSLCLSKGTVTDSQGLSLLSRAIWCRQSCVCVCVRVGEQPWAQGVRRGGGGLNLTATGLISAWQVVSLSPLLSLSNTHTHTHTNTRVCPHSPQPHTHTHPQQLPPVSQYRLLFFSSASLTTWIVRQRPSPRSRGGGGGKRSIAGPRRRRRHCRGTAGYSCTVRGKAGALLWEVCVCLCVCVCVCVL